MIPTLQRIHKILLIGVDVATHTRLIECLQPETHFSVVSQQGSEAVLADMSGFIPDVVVLDIDLSGQTGISTCQKIRARQGGAVFPILVLTGSDDGALRESSCHAGVSDVISKPVHLPHLIERLQSLLGIRENKVEHIQLASHYFHHSLEGIGIVDQQGIIVKANKACAQITGYTPADIVGKKLQLFKSNKHDDAFYQALWRTLRHKGKWQGEIWNRHKNGQIYPQWTRFVKIRNRGKIYYLAVFVDISKQKQQEKRIRQLAYYDELTGIGNRALFLEKLQQACAEARRLNQSLAILILNLDRFQLINETLGYLQGDNLLIHVAKQIRNLLSSEHTVTRWNGDEFVIILNSLIASHPGALQQANKTARRIQKLIAEPISLLGMELTMSCRIGLALYPHDTQVENDLLKQANIALQQTRQPGSNSVRAFLPPMLNSGLHRFNVEHALHKAIREQEFLLYYQPQYDTRGTIVGAECLIRWQHAQLGWISPADFIPVAEETGMIIAIGNWVLSTACQNLSLWLQQGLISTQGFSYLAVNISPKQFNHFRFAQEILNLIQQNNIDNASLLEIEITEHCLAQHYESAVKTVNQLHDAGIRVSVDDFGTGYSSLAYLKDFKLDTLKIDQSFIKECIQNPQHASIVRAIIAMSASLNINTLAEGVETEQHHQFLLDNHCQYFQGYLFSKPMPLSQFEDCLRQQQKPV